MGDIEALEGVLEVWGSLADDAGVRTGLARGVRVGGGSAMAGAELSRARSK